MKEAKLNLMRQSASPMQGTQSSSSYFEFSAKPSINRSYQWAVACGGDLIHMRADIINDLTTGTGKDDCRETLSEQWNVNSHASFIQMADSLKAGRDSVVYHQLAQGADLPNMEEEKKNLEQAKRRFKRDGLAKEVPNMLMWDLGQLVNISRFALDAGLIDRETALSYLREVAVQVKEVYHSWKELSVGYQFGRAVWDGIDATYETLKEGMEQLLTEADSPWLTLPFELPLNFDE
jgi:hypothetical protein